MKYVILLLTSTVVTYLSGIVIEQINSHEMTDKKKLAYKRCCLALSFVINLGILGYFKYSDFLVRNVQTALSAIHIRVELPAIDVLLPVGISFYTFQALSYTADIYKGKIKPEKNILKYALFVSFFPQLVAGPIERPGNLIPQFEERHKFDFENVRSGLMLMLWGYFMKLVIADKAAIIVDTVYGNYETYGGWYLIVATILFAIQIYCDFSGYSIIALGSARAMGFTLTDNFNAPYMSRSTSEFWRRWHVSLFNWFRDYIYIPLGGSRKGKARKYIHILIVFFVSGLWHGASWAFVIWGVLNGLWQIVGDILRPAVNRVKEFLHIDQEAFSHKLLQMILTFALVDFTWIFFRAPGARDALKIIRSIIRADNLWILFDDSLFELGLDWKNFMVLLIAIAVLVFADCLKYRGIVLRDFLARQGVWLRWLILIAGIVSVVLFGAWGSGYDEKAFIYFQF